MPIARVAKTAKQATLEFEEADETGQAYRPNDLVNQIRDEVSDWRRMEAGDRGVTHETARLLEHWRTGGPKTPPFFCQLEAVETAIWLAEVAPKQSPVLKRIAEGNEVSKPRPSAAFMPRRKGPDFRRCDCRRTDDQRQSRHNPGYVRK